MHYKGIQRGDLPISLGRQAQPHLFSGQAYASNYCFGVLIMKGIHLPMPRQSKRPYFFYSLVICMLAFANSPLMAENLIVTYDQQHELLTNNQSEPLLSIYESGKARAVYPSSMKKAGVYEWQLSDSEMQTLGKLIGQPGIQQFDEKAVEEAIELNDQQENSLPLYISDSTTTVIDVKNANAAGEVIESANGNTDELTTIAFEDVPDMTKENPEVSELVQLQSLQSRLEAILDQASQKNRIN